MDREGAVMETGRNIPKEEPSKNIAPSSHL